jgi:hypothetical protein
VVDRELLQLSAISKKSTSSSDKTEGCQRNWSAAWSGAPCCPEDEEDFGISESFFTLGFPFAYGYRRTQNGWELLSHPRYSPDLASSNYHLFGPLEDHLRCHHYETDEAVQEAELERISTAEAFLRFCNGGRNA